MNIIRKNCEAYQFIFPEPSSLREALFTPSIIARQDGTMAERMQRWLIDNGDFYTRAGKALNHYVFDSRLPKPTFIIDEAPALYQFLDRNFLAQSLAGWCFYMLTTSMILRSIELFFQSTKNPLNFSVLHLKTQEIVNFWIKVAVVGFTFCLGYDWADLIIFVFAPILLEKAFSFTWSNYFRQMHTLSSTKDFELRDFIFKNVQAGLIRSFSVILCLLYNPALLNGEKYSAWISLCKKDPEQFYIHDFYRASSSIEGILLEPILFMLGKMTFDLAYIMILKSLSKDADLRDPMGWIFSKYRRQIHSRVCREEQKSYSQENRKKIGFNRHGTSPDQNKILSHEISIPKSSLEFSETKNFTTERQEQRNSKIKIKTHRKDDPQPVVTKTLSTSSKPQASINSINLEVGGLDRTFQKIEDDSFKKEVWGVIFADSVEHQKLEKYERLLSNGGVGGGVRKLTGSGKHYEIGATMDSRLIGKMYDSGVYQSLQSFMRLEDALQVSQEFERQGIEDNVSLIVFSAEAKTHKDIARVASKL